MRIVAPQGAPSWVAPFAEQINRALGLAPTAPVKVYAVDNAQALAPLAAKDNTERQVYVRDIARLAVSNGVNWLRMDTGASIG